MIKQILFILLIVIILIIIYLGYSGAFSKVEFVQKEVGPYKLVYENHTGPYKNTAKVQNKIYYSLIEDKIETYKGFGIYYDNPKEVPENELKSEVGCIIEESDYKKLEEIKEKYNIKDLEKNNVVYTTMPYKNMMSIFIGIMKVYPKLNTYLEENNLEQTYIMEIYDVPNKKIEYIVFLKEDTKE